MCSFKLIYFIIFLFNIYRTNCLISDKRLCMNEDCSEPVSLARTLLRYSSPDPFILPFTANSNVKIFSKEAGSRTDLWGAEINGKRGYVPKSLVREIKIYGKPTVVVDTELSQRPEVPAEKLPEKKVQPDKVKEPFEVVDGTTILLDSDAISPSSTESPVLSTASSTINSLETPISSAVKETEATVEKQETSNENSVPPTQNTETATQESVVRGVLSSFKNWMNEDAEDDEDDDEDDEYDDEEEGNEVSEEETSKEVPTGNLDANPKKQDTVSEKTEGEHIVIKEDNAEKSEIKSNEGSENSKKEKTYETIAEEIKTSKENEIIVDKSSTEQAKEDKTEVNKSNNITEAATDKQVEGVTTKENKSNNSTEVKKSTEEIKAEDNESNTPSEVKAPTEAIKTEDNTSNKPTELKEPAETVTEEIKEEESKSNSATEVKEPAEVTSEGIKTEENKSNNPSEATEALTEENQLNHIKENIATETITEKAQVQEIKTEENKVTKTVTEKLVEATTLPSIDHGEALPFLAAEDVTPNPVAPPQDKIFSPVVASMFDKKPDSINNVKPDTQNNISLEEKSSNNSENVADLPLSLNSESLEIKGNISSSENNMVESIKYSTGSVEAGQDSHNLMSSDIVEDVKPEIPLQDDTPLEESPPPEIPPPTSWYSNANTNIDTSADINSSENTETLNNNDQQNSDLPSDIEINSLKNNEGILPNKLLGESQDEGILIEETVLKESGGMFSGLFSFFGGDKSEKNNNIDSPTTPIGNADQLLEENLQHSLYEKAEDGQCINSQENCDKLEASSMLDKLVFLMNSDILLYLGTTAVSCIIFIFIYMLIDKSSREAPLVEKINKLEKELLVTLKEKDILQDGASSVSQVPTEEINLLRHRLEQSEIVKQNLEMQILSLQKEVEDKQGLEDQIDGLEKELETSTEVGMELNRIISEILDPNNGGEKLKENVEQLQRQLSEQKWIINDISKSLSDKETENSQLQVQLDTSKRKSNELQQKLDEIVDQILKIEKERDQQHKSLQEEISIYQQKFSDETTKKELLNNEIQILRTQLSDAQRKAEIKIKEYQSLKDSLNGIKSMKNDKVALQSLLDATSVKAELEQLKSENENYSVQIKQLEAAKIAFERKCQAVIEDNNSLLKKYQESDKNKVEATMKLEVLNNYFNKREEELQSEIMKYKSIWDAKEGEATSTTERMKLMAEEIENYKSQNETLKQEIVSQEIDLKSQISMLEKKVHENWVTSRQMERKLEDTRQEAAQLRNRLTLRERAMIDERTQNRLQSSLDQNGELTLSPPPIESPTSPSMLFGGRDHITKSPPLPVLPPFLPPPPGNPFMPPPLHGLPFMPPPPSMFPGDHRPPPLGRMSSPPLNSRYSPDTSAFSPYGRNTPSPPYDSEYGASPPPMGGYSPYSSRENRRDYKRPMHISNGRNNKGSQMSSGSDHSNDSLDKVNRKHSKMV